MHVYAGVYIGRRDDNTNAVDYQQQQQQSSR